MRKSLFTLALLLFVGSFANAQQVEFEEYDLDNGMHVILHVAIYLSGIEKKS